MKNQVFRKHWPTQRTYQDSIYWVTHENLTRSVVYDYHFYIRRTSNACSPSQSRCDERALVIRPERLP